MDDDESDQVPKTALDWVLIGLTILVFAVAITGALWSFTHQAG